MLPSVKSVGQITSGQCYAGSIGGSGWSFVSLLLHEKHFHPQRQHGQHKEQVPATVQLPSYRRTILYGLKEEPAGQNEYHQKADRLRNMCGSVSPEKGTNGTEGTQKAICAVDPGAARQGFLVSRRFAARRETVEHGCDSPIEVAGLQPLNVATLHEGSSGGCTPENFRQVANYFPFPQPALRGEMVHFVTPPHLTLSEG